MTEYDRHALEFARANAYINHCTDLKTLQLDWNTPHLDDTFDVILGSEIVYKEGDYRTLLGLFRKYLGPGGRIILAEGVRKTSMEFFDRMREVFHVSAQKKILRREGHEIRVILCTMKEKD
jgi:hypothetical protein